MGWRTFQEMRWQMGEQVRGLDSQAESRQQLLQDVADFLRRKAEVEQEYSRGLEKLSERFSAKIRGSKEHQNFRKDQNLPSPLNCWYTILNQTRQASRDHGALSEIYTGHLALRLGHISDDVGRLARKSKEIEQQMQDELLKSISELQTAMKTYQTYRIDCLNAEGKLREVERQEEKRSGGKHLDLGGSPGGAALDKTPRRSSLRKVERLLEKRQSKFLESKLKCAKARNDYLLSLHAANAATSNYYVRDVNDLLDCFDLGFHLSLGKVLKTYLAAESRAQASWQQGLCTVEGAVDALDPLGDKSRLMEANPAAYCPPLCFDYQPHEGDEVSTVRAEGPLRNELVSRFQHIQSRLNAITLETDEVNKTLRATLQSLLDLLAAEEPEMLDAFQGCQSTESLKSTGSDAGGKQALAKRRANQQETESFYIMVRSWWNGSIGDTLSHPLPVMAAVCTACVLSLIVLAAGAAGRDVFLWWPWHSAASTIHVLCARQQGSWMDTVNNINTGRETLRTTCKFKSFSTTPVESDLKEDD
ncbi:rho GTPase-activating protein 4-like [Sphaerodactylus townsendi]|uniref:rho GTPase-activating protein 4-like n=1 Tax=Sphaerodactylus townsendi TaxID=933632 RepID=UPI00202734A9|nr:rho GTPase-activating protein 4-like [Sphaerodactylus townsendi]